MTLQTNSESGRSSVRSIDLTLEDVLITDQLEDRRLRPPNYAGENEALVALAGTLIESPQAVFQMLVEKVLALTKAESTGISVAENNGDEHVFRWYATAGEFSRYRGGTMPRRFSPCGTVLERRKSLLMREPERYYPFAQALCNPIEEVLLVPFYRANVPIGTVWAIVHSKEKHFDSEDRRITESLSRFAAPAVKNMQDSKRLEEAGQRLAEESRHKTEFLATLSHELRNPLSAIVNATEILRRVCPESGPAQTALGIVNRQTGQLTSLVNDLLDLSRAATGKLDIRKTRCSIADIAKMAAETGKPSLDARGHRFHMILPPVEACIEADAARLAQAVSNLLVNAARYTPNGGDVTLEVSVSSGKARVTVRDTGIGISPQMLPKIFDLYMQVGESTKGGLGIGLALVKRIVELHGGTVAATSDGSGSEFVICIPKS